MNVPKISIPKIPAYTAALVALLVLMVLGAILTVKVVATLNRENMLATSIVAKQRDNKNELDGMWKTIEQVAQVAPAEKQALLDIFAGYATARSGSAQGGSLANWIKEAVPNVNLTTYQNLQNVITSKRDGFVRRQKELLDLSRDHNRLLGDIPDGWICSVFGRKAIDVTIVTSTRTEASFQTGTDDNVTLPLK